MLLTDLDFSTYPTVLDGGVVASRYWKFVFKDPKTGWLRYRTEVYESPVEYVQEEEIRKFERTYGAQCVMLQIGLEYVQTEPGGEWEPVNLGKEAPKLYIEEYKKDGKPFNYTDHFWGVLRPQAYEGKKDKYQFKRPWTSKDQSAKDQAELAALKEKAEAAKAHMTSQQTALQEKEREIAELKRQLAAKSTGGA